MIEEITDTEGFLKLKEGDDILVYTKNIARVCKVLPRPETDLIESDKYFITHLFDITEDGYIIPPRSSDHHIFPVTYREMIYKMFTVNYEISDVQSFRITKDACFSEKILKLFKMTSLVYKSAFVQILENHEPQRIPYPLSGRTYAVVRNAISQYFSFSPKVSSQVQIAHMKEAKDGSKDKPMLYIEDGVTFDADTGEQMLNYLSLEHIVQSPLKSLLFQISYDEYTQFITIRDKMKAQILKLLNNINTA